MNFIKKIYNTSSFKIIRNKIAFLKQTLIFRSQFKIFLKSHGDRFAVLKKDKYPCLNDATGNTGFDKHYIYHTAWAARKISQTQPDLHTDISSYLYFSTLVSAFLPAPSVTIDVRSVDLPI